MSDNYTKNEIVWAKVKGFSWWPGMIADVFEEEDDQPTQFLVNFIGDNSHAELPAKQIAKYYLNYEEYSGSKKNKNLVDSIQIADNIISGKTTYEIEREKIIQKKSTQPIKSSASVTTSFKASGEGRTPRSRSNSSGTEQTSNASTKVQQPKKRGRPRKYPISNVADTNSNKSTGSNSEKKRAEMNARKVQYNFLNTVQTAHVKEEKPRQMPMQVQINPELCQQNGEKHPIIEPKGNFEITIPNNTNCELKTEDSSNQNGSDNMMNGDIKSETDFASKSIELKQIITELQKKLTDYPSSSNKNTAANVITNLIQDCLTRLSIESLSPQELAEYLSNNMGKLLYVLYSLLEEFEKYLHQNAQVLNAVIKKKKDGVENLLSTLKIRLINEYLEHGDFSKIFLEDFKRDIRRNNVKKESPPLPQKTEQMVIETKIIPLKMEPFELKLNQGPTLMQNFLKKIPVSGQSEKEKQTIDPTTSKMRTKICERIASLLGEKLNLNSEIAKTQSEIIENKIFKTATPEPPNDYKTGCKRIMKCITSGLITMESLIDSQPFDWEELDAKIQKFDNRDIFNVGQQVMATHDHT